MRHGSALYNLRFILTLTFAIFEPPRGFSHNNSKYSEKIPAYGSFCALGTLGTCLIFVHSVKLHL